MSPALRIQLLNSFSLFVDETPLVITETTRLPSLLAYLLLHRDAPQSRAKLAFLLWPDSTESQAYANLRNLVFKLRQLLPDAGFYLQTTRHTLHWYAQTNWQLDVQEFLDALNTAEQATDLMLQRQALEQAVALYQGDLLLNCLDEWLLPERDRLRELFLQALKRLITLLEQAGAYDAAITAASKLLRSDPLDEETYRRLMLLYTINGNRAAALRTYHTCTVTLERELAVEPDIETQALYARLMHSQSALTPAHVTPPTHSAHVLSTSFVGRKREWAELQQSWQRAQQGQVTIALIAGEAGVGKSRLAEEMRTWLQRQDIASASARCYAAEGALAYTPLIGWLKQEALKNSLLALPDLWLVEIARLMPELLLQRSDLAAPAPITESWQQQRFLEALTQVLVHTCQPLLLILDDLQWVDRETLTWLHYLLRNNPSLPLLLICTVRVEEVVADHPLTTWLASLQRAMPITHVTLDPLDRTATALLAEQIVGKQLDQQSKRDLYQETEGNPLFIVETIRANTFALQAKPERSRGTLAHLSPTVRSVLTTRLAQLSPATYELASIASVIGRSFPFNVLVRASGYSEQVVVQSLEELWQRRIVYEQGEDAYDFSHDKLREAAYAALSSARRRLLHQRVGEALISIYADQLDTISGQIAAHYEKAGLLEQAIPYYEQTGEVAIRIYADTEAIHSFQHAIDLHQACSQPQYSEIARLRERIGDIFALSDEYDHCIKIYQEAMTQVPADDYRWHARLQRKIARIWDSNTDAMQGLLARQEAARILRLIAFDERDLQWQQEWLQIEIEQLWTLSVFNRLDDMTEILREIQQPVMEFGTILQQANYFRSLYIRDSRLLHFRVTEQILETAYLALSLCQKTNNASEIANFMVTLGCCLMWDGQLVAAEEMMQGALLLAEQRGDRTVQSFSLLYMTVLFRRQKQREKARQSIEQLLLSPSPGYQSICCAGQSWLAWCDGNYTEAQKLAQFALTSWVSAPFIYPSQWTALWPLIDITVRQGHVEDALTYIHQLLDPTQEFCPLPLEQALEAAIEGWDNHQQEQATLHIKVALALAQEHGYL